MLKEFESVAKKIEADFDATQALPHSGVKGQVREKIIVHNFLRQYLPKRYSTGSGLITDSIGQVSQQQDLVIYDEFTSSVLQDYEDNKVFFAEQILATIEVKSVLNRRAVRDVMNKARSVGTLVRRPRDIVQLAPGFGVSAIAPPIVSFGFGYTSSLSLEQVRDEAQSYAAQFDSPCWPSAILILNDREGKSGIIVTVDAKNISTILLFPKSDSRFASVKAKTKGEALLHFYLILMYGMEVSGIMVPGPDYIVYAKYAGLESPHLSIGPDALRGTRFMLDGEPVEVDDMVRIRELQQKLSSDEKISDDEIVELFKLAIRQPKIDSGFREGTMFFLDETPFSQISPLKVRQVIENLQIAPLDKELEQTLSEFLQLIRHVRESSKILRIIDTRTGAQHFAWKGPKEN